ncbi:LacI family DNA-binding transcriptional regulator [Agromyces larvae]|uniref:LacI family transcriptional regulator n=1 Tax=Agromyces larvae TaxID=2929802 RepID=A0ABY4C1N6_9MICO|nr:LacI family DNA-binding transcriptional regulator [Agromyces larvae]UOE44056.1 LacI family transcriptional regulator [Agromyces larvae]
MNGRRYPDTGARTRKPTIRDVARVAGVSTATVSYVLNDTPGQTITEATKQRVTAAAESLGYVPHAVARTLRAGASRIVLLNVGGMLGGHSLDSFINGMSDELRRHEHALLVVTAGATGGPLPPEVVTSIAPRATLDLASILSEQAGDSEVLGIADGYRAGLAFHTRTQLRHLVEHGHREIAVALPLDPTALFAEARLQHLARFAGEFGIPPVRILRLDPSGDRAQRLEAVRHLAERTPVTAVVAYDDDVAFGVLSTMSQLGLRAPSDLAVIGFDASERARFWEPALTTVRIDAESFGRRAARVVLGVDPGEWTEAPSSVIAGETV